MSDPLPEFDRNLALSADRTILAREQVYVSWGAHRLTALAAAVGARTLYATVVPAWLAVVTGVLLALFAAFASSPPCGARLALASRSSIQAKDGCRRRC